MTSAALAVEPTPLHYREFQEVKNDALTMVITSDASNISTSTS